MAKGIAVATEKLLDEDESKLSKIEIKYVALITRSGSYSILNHVLTTKHPERLTKKNIPENQTRWHPVYSLAGYCIDMSTSGVPNPLAVMVRNPVERFRSACARQNKTVEEGLGLLESDVHFWPLKDMGLIADGIVYFRFPDQINDCSLWLGLPVPVPQENEEPEEKKKRKSKKEKEASECTK